MIAICRCGHPCPTHSDGTCHVLRFDPRVPFKDRMAFDPPPERCPCACFEPFEYIG